jgi:hypothetical protein
MLRCPVLTAFPSSRSSDLWTQCAVLSKHTVEPLFEFSIEPPTATASMVPALVAADRLPTTGALSANRHVAEAELP